MMSVDPDVRRGDPRLLQTIPDADGDVVREKFVLVPEVSPSGSMTSAPELTFLPALSEVYSPIFLAGVGVEGGSCWLI